MIYEKEFYDIISIIRRLERMVWVKPYNRSFLLEKIKEYNKVIKENKIGNHRIVLSKNDEKILKGYGYEKENDLDVETLKLFRDDNLVMELSAKEVEGTYGVIKKAKGRVGVVGLGLGYTVLEMSKNKNVKEIVVYESELDVIKFFKQNFGNIKKVQIVHKNAFEAEKEKFDYFYVDIYGYELSEKAFKDYQKFKGIHEIKDYVFFGVEHFLLSARYEEIIWVFVPELWMELSKNSFTALQECNLLSDYKKIKNEKVSLVLEGFKKIFDEED